MHARAALQHDRHGNAGQPPECARHEIEAVGCNDRDFVLRDTACDGTVAMRYVSNSYRVLLRHAGGAGDPADGL